MNANERRAWEPVVVRSTATESLLDDIARALARRVDDPAAYPVHDEDPVAPLASAALFFAYLALGRDDDGAATLAARALERAIEAATSARTPWLFGGLGLLGWVAQHLDGEVVDLGEVHPGSAIDAVVELGLASEDETYDLISGAAGYGLYAASRTTPAADRILARALERLEAARGDGELAFAKVLEPYIDTPPGAPTHGQNLGVAHGVPGVLGALAAMAPRLPSHACRVRALLREGVETLAARTPMQGAAYPTHWPGDSGGRFAWCYGTPGLTLPWLHASKALGDDAMLARALESGREAARADAERSLVRDACVCHGAAGLIEAFLRLHQESGEPLFADAARAWTSRLLAMRTSGFEVGVPSWRKEGPREDADLLMGTAGVGLALLAATTDVEPRWDRVLLLGEALDG